jgi:deoxyxylulose-5-phosphate synthase
LPIISKSLPIWLQSCRKFTPRIRIISEHEHSVAKIFPRLGRYIEFYQDSGKILYFANGGFQSNQSLRGKTGRAAILGLGNFYNLAEEAADKLKERGIEATVINPLFITGQDKELLESLKSNHELVATLEDGILDGGFVEKIARFYGADKMKVLNFGLPKNFYDRYDYEVLAKENHLTAEQIAEDVLNTLGR